VLEPDEGKSSSPVLRGLGVSNGAWLLDQIDFVIAHELIHVQQKHGSKNF
jgi:hypothetical protein